MVQDTPRRFTPWKEMRCPLYSRLGALQGWSGRMRKVSSQSGFGPWTVQPVANQLRKTICRMSNFVVSFVYTSQWFESPSTSDWTLEIVVVKYCQVLTPKRSAKCVYEHKATQHIGAFELCAPLRGTTGISLAAKRKKNTKISARKCNNGLSFTLLS
jgi:hypothetical protein